MRPYGWRTLEHWWNGTWSSTLYRHMKLYADPNGWLYLEVRIGSQTYLADAPYENAAAQRHLALLRRDRGPWKAIEVDK